MPILAFLSSLFAPALGILNNLHTSDAERMQLQNEMAKIQAGVNEKMVELQEAQLKAQEVDAGSKYWITGNWHALVSLALTVILIADSFGWIHASPKIYDLAQYFLCGFVGVHGATNVATTVVKAIKGR